MTFCLICDVGRFLYDSFRELHVLTPWYLMSSRPKLVRGFGRENVCCEASLVLYEWIDRQA